MLKNGGRLLGGSVAKTRNSSAKQGTRTQALYLQASQLPAFLVPAWADLQQVHQPRQLQQSAKLSGFHARKYTTRTLVNKQQQGETLASTSYEAPVSSAFLDTYQADLDAVSSRPSPWYGHLGSPDSSTVDYSPGKGKGKLQSETVQEVDLLSSQTIKSPEQALLQARYALTVLSADYTSQSENETAEAPIHHSRFPSAILYEDAIALGQPSDSQHGAEERPGNIVRRRMSYRLAESSRILADLLLATQGAELYAIQGHFGLRQALAKCLMMEDQEASHLLSDVGQLDRRKDTSDSLQSQVNTVVLAHYWLKLGRRFALDSRSDQESSAPAATSDDSAVFASSFSSKDQKRLHRFVRSCIQNLRYASPNDAVALLRPIMQLHALDRQYTYKADLPDMKLLDWSKDLLAGDLDSKPALRLILALLMPETAVFAEAQGIPSDEYDKSLAGLWKQMQSHSVNLSPLELDRFIRYSLNQGLPLFASQVFLDYLRLVAQTSSGKMDSPTPAPTPESADGQYLAKLASKIMSICLRLGRTETVSEICVALEKASGTAAAQPNIWQRKMQLLFHEHRTPDATASPTDLMASLERFLDEMQAASVPLDAYFLSSLLRGITASGLPLGKTAKLLHAINLSFDRDERKSSIFQLAVADSDLAMYERAAKQNIQLPWLPLLERDTDLLTSSASDHGEQAPVNERLTALGTILRHAIYRKQWGQALASYEGLLELFGAIEIKEAVHLSLMQSAFIRLLSGTLEAHRLEGTLHTLRLTLDYLGAQHIGSRAISRAVMAACSPLFYAHQSIRRRSAAKEPATVSWSGLSAALQLARDWARGRNNPQSESRRLSAVDGHSHPPRILREVLSYWNHLDDLARATLQAVFLPSKAQQEVPVPLEEFRTVIQTLLFLNTDVDYNRWWERIEKQAEELRLEESGRGSQKQELWLAVKADIRELCRMTQEQKTRKSSARRSHGRKSKGADDGVEETG